MLRRETGCGLMEASVAIDKLIKAFKNRPLFVMDKPVYLKANHLYFSLMMSSP